MGTIFSEVGERIKRAREERGWTQAQLADAVNCSDAAIGNYESGRRGVGLDDLYKIAAALNRPFAYFVGAAEPHTETLRRQVEQEIRRDMAGFVGVRLLPVVVNLTVRPLLDERNVAAIIPVPRELAKEAQFLVHWRRDGGGDEYWFCAEIGPIAEVGLALATVGDDEPRLLLFKNGAYWPVGMTHGLQAWLPIEVTLHATVVGRFMSGPSLVQDMQSAAQTPGLAEIGESLTAQELSEVLKYVAFLKSTRKG